MNIKRLQTVRRFARIEGRYSLLFPELVCANVPFGLLLIDRWLQRLESRTH